MTVIIVLNSNYLSINIEKQELNHPCSAYSVTPRRPTGYSPCPWCVQVRSLFFRTKSLRRVWIRNSSVYEGPTHTCYGRGPSIQHVQKTDLKKKVRRIFADEYLLYKKTLCLLSFFFNNFFFRCSENDKPATPVFCANLCVNVRLKPSEGQKEVVSRCGLAVRR